MWWKGEGRYVFEEISVIGHFEGGGKREKICDHLPILILRRHNVWDWIRRIFVSLLCSMLLLGWPHFFKERGGKRDNLSGRIHNPFFSGILK